MPMLAISDADIIRSNGFDALIMTRILLIGLQMMTLMTVLGVGVRECGRGGIAGGTSIRRHGKHKHPVRRHLGQPAGIP